MFDCLREDISMLVVVAVRNSREQILYKKTVPKVFTKRRTSTAESTWAVTLGVDEELKWKSR